VGDSPNRCQRPASSWAPDPNRRDAVTFFCERCQPDNARPIAREGEFLELCISGIVVIAASTLAQADAGTEAVRAIQEALEPMGGTFVGVRLAGALKRPLPILGGNRAAAAPDGPRSLAGRGGQLDG